MTLKKSNVFLWCIFTLIFISCKNKSTENFSAIQGDILCMLVGTYDSDNNQGLSVYEFNSETGEIKFVSQFSAISNPSYLAVSADEQFVYAVSENDKAAAVAVAFSFDKETGTLKLIDSEQTRGDSPCYIAVNKGNNFVTTANYSGGNLSVFPVNKDGRLLPISQVFDFQNEEGDSPASRIHTTFFSPDEKYLFVTDLGKDKIYRYTVKADADSGMFLQQQTTVADLEKGSGPRHLSFSRDGHWMYCLCERSGKIAVFQYDEGNLNLIQSVASDTTSGTDKKGSADIHLTPDGQFLYSSNRLKSDGIAIFSVNSDGTLKSIGYQPTGGHPRNFIITPNGKFLLVASRDNNNVSVFSIHKETGLLENTSIEIQIEKPVCLKFISRHKQ